MAPACHLATATAAAVVAFPLLGAPRRGRTRLTDASRVGMSTGSRRRGHSPLLQGARHHQGLATTADQRRELCECVHLVMIAGGRVIPRRGQLLRTACGFGVDFLPTNFYFNCSRLPVRTLVCIIYTTLV
ncbi:hypothetical protein VPH35_127117 [Triticum aestivum]